MNSNTDGEDSPEMFQCVEWLREISQKKSSEDIPEEQRTFLTERLSYLELVLSKCFKNKPHDEGIISKILVEQTIKSLNWERVLLLVNCMLKSPKSLVLLKKLTRLMLESAFNDKNPEFLKKSIFLARMTDIYFGKNDKDLSYSQWIHDSFIEGKECILNSSAHKTFLFQTLSLITSLDSSHYTLLHKKSFGKMPASDLKKEYLHSLETRLIMLGLLLYLTFIAFNLLKNLYFLKGDDSRDLNLEIVSKEVEEVLGKFKQRN